MNKKMFIVMISILAVFFLSAQACMQGVTTGIARECVGENDIVCDDTEAYQCQMAQFGIGFYVTRAPRYDVECGGEPEEPEARVSCTNSRQDGSETDVDCGGPDCQGCLEGFTCAINRDCAPFYECVSKTVTDTAKWCVEDLDAVVECTAADITNCENFACNVDTCYTLCTSSDTECASGYACSITGTECLLDDNGDGVADVEETTAECISASDCSSYGIGYTCDLGVCTAPTTSSLCSDTDGGRDYTRQGTISGGVLYPTNNPVDSLTDSCDSLGHLIEYYCYSTDSIMGYAYTYDCLNSGADYVCENGACVSSGTANQAPVAMCLVSSTGRVGIPITYSGESSSDADGDTLTYAWDFNEDGVVDSTSQKSSSSASYTYTTAGTYTVTLTVTDNHGATDSCTSSITISAATTDSCNCPAGYNCDSAYACYTSCSVFFEWVQNHCSERYTCYGGSCVAQATHSCASGDTSDCEEGYVCQSSTACYASCTVSEYGGSSTGCAEGYTCFAGSCIAETTADSCTDTDGGYDIYETGTTTKGTSTYTDSCSSGKLTEYWCSNDEIKSSSGLNCAITAFPICYQGACVECSTGADCDPGESCDSSTHTCEEEDHSYSYSKANDDDYIKFKLADLDGTGMYTTSSLGYLTTLTLEEGEDYTTSAIAHVSVDTSGGNNYFDFTSSSTPRYINFEDNIEKPEYWLKVTAKVKVDATSLNSNQIILAQLTSTAGSQLYALLTKNGQYVFKISVDNTVYEVECGAPNANWQELIGLYNGEDIVLFVDGIYCDSTASGLISSQYSNDDFVIGYSTLTSSMQFKGYIDDIYIYGE